MLLTFRIRGVFNVCGSLCYGPQISSKNLNYDFHMEDDEYGSHILLFMDQGMDLLK